MKPKKLSELKFELSLLENVNSHSLVIAAKNKALLERRDNIEELKKQIVELKDSKHAKKPRWPENTPANILKVCEEYWKGTTEFYTFRIHLWNEKAVWSSYPSGGYSTNGGWVPTPVAYHLISLTEKDERGCKAKRFREIDRRVSVKELQEELDKIK